MTVKELRKILEIFPEDMIVTILREGNDHSALITEKTIFENFPYFPDDSADEFYEDGDFRGGIRFLNIGVI